MRPLGTSFAPPPSVDTSRNVNADSARDLRELCFGGDWACANGDLGTLGFIAKRLAASAREPLHCKLLVLAEMCGNDPDHAIASWLRLKNQMLANTRRLPS